MTTLLLSTWALPASRPLADEARRRGWKSLSLDDRPGPKIPGDIVFYGSLLVARDVARRYSLALIEPPLDMLVGLPPALLLRQVGFGKWSDLSRFSKPLFLKPADPLAKIFDAGVYRDRGQIRTIAPIPEDTPVLMAEPVEWLAEYRCFVLDGKVVTTSPYLSFGHPLQHQSARAASVAPVPVMDLCRRLLSSAEIKLPPAFVVDIGLIEERGWAIVEFNPVWCAGLLSADPVKVLDVLRRSCRNRARASAEDLQWVRDD